MGWCSCAGGCGAQLRQRAAREGAGEMEGARRKKTHGREMLGMGRDKVSTFVMCPLNFLQLHLRHSLAWPVGSLTAERVLILGFVVLLGWLLVMFVWPK